MTSYLRRWVPLLALVLAGTVATSACSSSASKSNAGTTGSGGAGGTAASSAGGTADVAAAQALVARYSSGPTAFPVDVPLAKKLAAGKALSYLQCGTPYCALLGQLYGLATKQLGVPLQIVKGGTTANSLQSALSSIEATKPAAFLAAGVNLSSLGGGLSRFAQAKIPVVVSAILGTQADGISADVNGTPAVGLGGQLLADWTIANVGAKAKVTWYTLPELDFAKTETTAFTSEMTKNCSSCQVRVVNIPAASVGTTAPALVTSDLQAHSGQTVALFASMEAAQGVPAALKQAGISVKIGGYAPTPENLQDIEAGNASVAIGLDAGIMAFTMVDAAVRQASGEPLTSGESQQTPVLQVLTQQNLHGDVSKGWSGYPDFMSRFATLWAAAK